MNLSVEDALAFEFLRSFAFLEFEMKRTRFLRGNETRAQPDWVKLRNTLHKNAALDLDDLTTREDVAYLLDNPPQKQIVQNGYLDWKPLERGTGEDETAWVIRLMKTVRNNLFHGGKIAYGMMDDPARDPKLVRGALEVLDAVYHAVKVNGT